MQSRTEHNFSINKKIRQNIGSYGAQGHIRPAHSKHHAFGRAVDGITIYTMLKFSAFLNSTQWDAQYALAGLIALLVFIFLADYNEVYYPCRGARLYKEALGLTFAWVFACAVLIAVAFFTKTSEDFSRLVIGTWFLMTPLAMIFLSLCGRIWLSYFTRSRRTCAIVGANNLGKRLENALAEMPWMGYRFIGYFDDREVSDNNKWRLSDSEVSICGGLDELYRDAKAGRVDIIYIALPMCAEKRVKALISKLANTTVSVFVIPDLFVFDLLHARWTTIQGIPAVSVYDSPHLSVDGLEKRMEDIILSIAISTLIAIPMLLITIGIKLTSPGPILFKQRRYGIDGDEIEVWKFRSMKVCQDGDNVPQAIKNDPRVTKFGAFLRRTSLDELPQFLNVLQGTMSVVGPRPHAIAHNEYYRRQIQGYMLRHKVKPGITGLAQIKGFRGETETTAKMAGRVHYDLAYIRSWSLWLDLKIVFLTLFKGFVGQTAY